jgi:DNA-binding LacI/PurR family transcriptional regulator
VPSQRPSTARSRLVAAVTQEILSRDDTAPFAIASEHQLCRRFNVSRVTVRLALGDIENRGLIYRKHGKGTFAHGRSTRIHRYLGILMKSPHAAEHRPFAEMLRGAQTVMNSLRSAILLASTPPESWQADKAASLGGVIVAPEGVTPADLEVLRNRNLPYLLFTETDLPGPRIIMNQRKAARTMTEELLRLGHRRFALLTGYDATFDGVKRLGIHDALKDTGIDPAQVPEISADGDESAMLQAARSVLELNPRPTAVLTTDDSLGCMVSYHARRNLNLKVPEDLSVIGFHDWAYLKYIEPALTTVYFEFFAAGQKAAEALSSAALTGEKIQDIVFEPCFRPGQTIGPAPK